MPSLHPRCSQHGLVAPDGMCVLCRKQASSGPPPQQHEPAPEAPPRAAAAAPESTDKYAALLVGVALVTMAATYVLDSTKDQELVALREQRSEAQRQEEAELARLHDLALAATQAEERSMNAAPVHRPAAPDVVSHDEE